MMMSRRPSLHNPFQPPVVAEIYSDSRSHGPQGPVRHVRIPQVTSQGGGAIAKNEDGQRCVVAGKDSLRILRASEPGVPNTADHKFAVGHGGYRIDASRNFWTGSGLKVDSASTDVVWGHGHFSNKILTSARNGELIMWDLNKTGPTKYERRVRQHVRSIHKIAYSTVLRDYCITGSADGDIRVWDLRNLTDCIMKIRHPAAVRSVVFSPVHWQPRHAITGLDNGNIYRWDLNMGQRGQLDRIPLAHSGPILSLDWTLPPTYSSSTIGRSSGSGGLGQGGNWYSNMGSGLFDELNSFGGSATVPAEGDGTGMGWLASGGLDRCVKVWDMTPPAGEAHVSRKPIYTMHTSFPIRRVAWRLGYECELAVTSYLDVATGAQSTSSFESSSSSLGLISSSPKTTFGHLSSTQEVAEDEKPVQMGNNVGNPIEIWDVRRGYVAKWTVRGSSVEGGVTDIAFANSHTLWAQHFSGVFSQLDLRYSMRTLDAIPRAAATWDPTGVLVFVTDHPKRFEVPYDDVTPDKKVAGKRKLKALGSKPYTPATQTLGLMSGHGLVEEPEQFAKLARDYIYTGHDRIEICSRNAEAAFDAGKHDAAQTWMLLSSLLTNTSPSTTDTPAITLSPLPLLNPKLPHSSSAPASIPTISQVTAPPTPIRAHSEDVRAGGGEFTSPNSLTGSVTGSLSRRNTGKGRTKSTSSAGTGFLSPVRTTPASSTTPSPHRGPIPLPPLPASLSTTVLARRKSGAGLPMSLGTTPVPPMRSRLGSSYRRPSFKAPSMQSSIMTESDSRSHSSLRHVGEGALDDSDSDGSGSDGGHHRLESTAVSETESPSLKEDIMDGFAQGDRSRPSPLSASSSSSVQHWHSRASSVQPSPLSRVAVQESWTEDERDEGDSPSPASTDSEASSDELEDLPSPGLRPPHPLSQRQSSSRSRRSSARSTRTKSRSRSSTVASLSVSVPIPASGSRTRLTKQQSRSSIRTVTATATPTSMHGFDRLQDAWREQVGDIHRDATVRDVSGPAPYPAGRSDVASVRSTLYHPRSRPRSEMFSNDEDYDPGLHNTSLQQATDMLLPSASQHAAREAILQTEARIRHVAWQAMQETLEIVVDDGDIQMSAMLALVASKELQVNGARVLRLVEGYIDLLMRMRLHNAAAYIRKYASQEAIQSKTEIGTTLEIACANCRKPLLQTQTSAGKSSGSYCNKCKAMTAKCAICRLPVRALAFTCSLCMHGGHQECYEQYYLRRPLLTISSAPSPPAAIAEPLPAVPSGPSHHSQRTSESRGRGRTPSVSRDGDMSDDGTSAREEEGTSLSKAIDQGPGVAAVAIQGRPCAAGCGHYCWATNDALSGSVIVHC